jgi:hypothetical protein
LTHIEPVSSNGGWWLCLALPLLLTGSMCVKGGLSAKIAPRFEGPKARALIALLIYLGPLLRGWSRIKWRLKALPAIAPIGEPALEQRGRWSWRARGFVLSYWNEIGAEKEVMLGALMRECAAERYPVTMDAGWEDWDLNIASGPVSGAHILVASENHGADKRLLRVRAALRLSPIVSGVIGGTASVALAGLIFGSMTVAAIFVLLTIATSAVAALQLALFAWRLHSMIEAAAQESRLIPVNSLSRALPASPPRTA